MNIDKFYICHYSKLTERKKYIYEHINKYDLHLEWILSFDKENIDYYSLEERFPIINKFNPIFGRRITKPEISLSLKHLYIFEDVLKNNYENVVVFEDDIVLCDDFTYKLNYYLKQLPDDYDTFWIGSCCNLHISNTTSNKNVYKSNTSRCTHAYVISKNGCLKMLENSKYLNHPIDWFFNFVMEHGGMNSYWAEPELVNQNSFFETSIQGK